MSKGSWEIAVATDPREPPVDVLCWIRGRGASRALAGCRLSSGRLADAASREVQAYGRSQRPTAIIMIVEGDRVINPVRRRGATGECPLRGARA
jgi:hypothetical protein